MNFQFFKLRQAFMQEFITTSPADQFELTLRYLDATFHLGEIAGAANADRQSAIGSVGGKHGSDNVEVTVDSADDCSLHLVNDR